METEQVKVKGQGKRRRRITGIHTETPPPLHTPIQPSIRSSAAPTTPPLSAMSFPILPTHPPTFLTQTHRTNQIINPPCHIPRPGRHMLPRHRRDFDRRLRLRPFDTNERGVKEIESGDRGECFSSGGFVVVEVDLGVGGREDGEGAPEGGFDVVVEVVAMRGEGGG